MKATGKSAAKSGHAKKSGDKARPLSPAPRHVSPAERPLFAMSELRAVLAGCCDSLGELTQWPHSAWLADKPLGRCAMAQRAKRALRAAEKLAAKIPPALLVICVLCASVVAFSGCAMFDAHVREFDLMRGMAADAASRLEDGSIGQAQISGQAVNPGIVLEAAIVYRASARYEGLAGQFMVATQGKLGRQIPWADILGIINTAPNTEAAYRRILELLMQSGALGAPDAGAQSGALGSPAAAREET